MANKTSQPKESVMNINNNLKNDNSPPKQLEGMNVPPLLYPKLQNVKRNGNTYLWEYKNH